MLTAGRLPCGPINECAAASSLRNGSGLDPVGPRSAMATIRFPRCATRSRSRGRPRAMTFVPGTGRRPAAHPLVAATPDPRPGLTHAPHIRADQGLTMPTAHTTLTVNSDYFRLDDDLAPGATPSGTGCGPSSRDVLPIINDYWERAQFPFELVPKIAQLGVVGGAITGYGCPGLSRLAAGMVTLELSRGDGSVNTFLGVQNGLAMGSINMLGSEEQKQRWLPAMARLDKVGAFALTEPGHGSDSVGLETTARRDGDHWVLNGAKRWIGNGNIAHVVDRLGPGCRRRQGQGLRRRKGGGGAGGNDRLPGGLFRGTDHREDRQTRHLATRHHPDQRAGAGREQTGRGQLVPRRVQGADRDPRRRVLGGGRARRRRLRGRADLRRAAGNSSANPSPATNWCRTSWPTCSPRSPPSS